MQVSTQAHAAAGLSIALIGAAYWWAKFVWAPRRGGYRLYTRKVVGEDGVPRKVLTKASRAELAVSGSSI